MSTPEAPSGFEVKKAETEVVRINAALKNAVGDFQSVKANVDRLLGDIYQKFPQLNPEMHPRLVELSGKYDALMAKVGTARGDVVRYAMCAIAAGVVEHHKSQGSNWHEDSLYQKITNDLSEAEILRRTTSRAEVDKWIDFTQHDLGY